MLPAYILCVSDNWPVIGLTISRRTAQLLACFIFYISAGCALLPLQLIARSAIIMQGSKPSTRAHSPALPHTHSPSLPRYPHFHQYLTHYCVSQSPLPSLEALDQQVTHLLSLYQQVPPGQLTLADGAVRVWAHRGGVEVEGRLAQGDCQACASKGQELRQMRQENEGLAVRVRQLEVEKQQVKSLHRDGEEKLVLIQNEVTKQKESVLAQGHKIAVLEEELRKVRSLNAQNSSRRQQLIDQMQAKIRQIENNYEVEKNALLQQIDRLSNKLVESSAKERESDLAQQASQVLLAEIQELEQANNSLKQQIGSLQQQLQRSKDKKQEIVNDDTQFEPIGVLSRQAQTQTETELLTTLHFSSSATLQPQQQQAALSLNQVSHKNRQLCGAQEIRQVPVYIEKEFIQEVPIPLFITKCITLPNIDVQAEQHPQHGTEIQDNRGNKKSGKMYKSSRSEQLALHGNNLNSLEEESVSSIIDHIVNNAGNYMQDSEPMSPQRRILKVRPAVSMEQVDENSRVNSPRPQATDEDQTRARQLSIEPKVYYSTEDIHVIHAPQVHTSNIMDYNRGSKCDTYGLSSKFEQLRLKKVDSQVIFVNSFGNRGDDPSNEPACKKNEDRKIYDLELHSKSYRPDQEQLKSEEVNDEGYQQEQRWSDHKKTIVNNEVMKLKQQIVRLHKVVKELSKSHEDPQSALMQQQQLIGGHRYRLVNSEIYSALRNETIHEQSNDMEQPEPSQPVSLGVNEQLHQSRSEHQEPLGQHLELAIEPPQQQPISPDAQHYNTMRTNEPSSVLPVTHVPADQQAQTLRQILSLNQALLARMGEVEGSLRVGNERASRTEQLLLVKTQQAEQAEGLARELESRLAIQQLEMRELRELTTFLRSVQPQEIVREVPVEIVREVQTIKHVYVPHQTVTQVTVVVEVPVIQQVPVELVTEVLHITEVPILISRPVPFLVLIETVRQVPVEVIRHVQVTKEIVKQVEVIREVEVIKEVPVESFKYVPVQVVKEVEVPVYITKEVEVPVYITKQVEVPVYITKEVEVPVYITKQVEVVKQVPIQVTKQIEVIKEVIKQVPIYITKEVEVPVYITKEVQVPVEIIREVEVIRQVPVIQQVQVVKEVEVVKEVQIVKEVEVIKEVIKEVEIVKEVIKQVTNEVIKEVQVIKENNHFVYVNVPQFIYIQIPFETILEQSIITEIEVPREIIKEVEIIKQVPFEVTREVTKQIQVFNEVVMEVPTPIEILRQVYINCPVEVVKQVVREVQIIEHVRVPYPVPLLKESTKVQYHSIPLEIPYILEVMLYVPVVQLIAQPANNSEVQSGHNGREAHPKAVRDFQNLLVKEVTKEVIREIFKRMQSKGNRIDSEQGKYTHESLLKMEKAAIKEFIKEVLTKVQATVRSNPYIQNAEAALFTPNGLCELLRSTTNSKEAQDCYSQTDIAEQTNEATQTQPVVENAQENHQQKAQHDTLDHKVQEVEIAKIPQNIKKRNKHKGSKKPLEVVRVIEKPVYVTKQVQIIKEVQKPVEVIREIIREVEVMKPAPKDCEVVHVGQQTQSLVQDPVVKLVQTKQEFFQDKKISDGAQQSRLEPELPELPLSTIRPHPVSMQMSSPSNSSIEEPREQAEYNTSRVELRQKLVSSSIFQEKQHQRVYALSEQNEGLRQQLHDLAQALEQMQHQNAQLNRHIQEMQRRHLALSQQSLIQLQLIKKQSKQESEREHSIEDILLEADKKHRSPLKVEEEKLYSLEEWDREHQRNALELQQRDRLIENLEKMLAQKYTYVTELQQENKQLQQLLDQASLSRRRKIEQANSQSQQLNELRLRIKQLQQIIDDQHGQIVSNSDKYRLIVAEAEKKHRGQVEEAKKWQESEVKKYKQMVDKLKAELKRFNDMIIEDSDWNTHREDIKVQIQQLIEDKKPASTTHFSSQTEISLEEPAIDSANLQLQQQLAEEQKRSRILQQRIQELEGQIIDLRGRVSVVEEDDELEKLVLDEIEDEKNKNKMLKKEIIQLKMELYKANAENSKLQAEANTRTISKNSTTLYEQQKETRIQIYIEQNKISEYKQVHLQRQSLQNQKKQEGQNKKQSESEPPQITTAEKTNNSSSDPEKKEIKRESIPPLIKKQSSQVDSAPKRGPNDFCLDEIMGMKVSLAAKLTISKKVLEYVKNKIDEGTKMKLKTFCPQRIMIRNFNEKKLELIEVVRVSMKGKSHENLKYYSAPEIIKGFSEDEKSLVWSIGITLDELFCGSLFYSSVESIVSPQENYSFRAGSEIRQMGHVLQKMVVKNRASRDTVDNAWFCVEMFMS